MIRKLFFILSAFLIFVACNHPNSGITTMIGGSFPALSNQILHLDELDVRKSVTVDSVILEEDGSFLFTFPLKQAGFYVLRTGKDNILLLQLEKGEHVTVKSDHKQFEDGYEVSGSPGSETLAVYDRFMTHQKARIDSIAKVYYDAKGSDNFMQTKAGLDSIYQKIIDDQHKYVIGYISKNPGALPSLIMINRRLGNEPPVDEEKDFIYLHRIDSALSVNYPGNKHTLDNHQRVMEIQGRIFDRRMAEEKVKTGNKAPDIVLTDTAGKPVSLKSYTGSPTIIYFWAGWNAVSRQDYRTLKKDYDKLKSDGIKILGVSLDENAVVWKGAIKLDRTPWTQVSDLKGLESPIKKAYNLPDDLPFYYLIDKDQHIVYKNKSLDSLLIRIDQLFLQPQS